MAILRDEEMNENVTTRNQDLIVSEPQKRCRRNRLTETLQSRFAPSERDSAKGGEIMDRVVCREVK